MDLPGRKVLSPLGPLQLAATEKGLRLVAFGSQDPSFSFLERNDRPMKLRLVEVLDHPILRQAERELMLYFEGRLTRFQVPVDLEFASPFQKKVLQKTLEIPYGSVVSYGILAIQIGFPAAGRAVGKALGANPLPIIIPCHRVLPASGKVGGYTPGPEIKKKLLLLEGAAFRE